VLAGSGERRRANGLPGAGSTAAWPMTGLLLRLVSIADQPDDEDDWRFRKRAGVAAGWVMVLAPIFVPMQQPGQAIAWILAACLSAFAAINLAVLARTRAFERYLFPLLAVLSVFVIFSLTVTGGVVAVPGGLVWGFDVPALAILILGPRRATPWFLVFLAIVVIAVLTDPWVRTVFAPPTYPAQLLGAAANSAVPLVIVYALLRYTDIRRRAAEARADELLTNAIPAGIARRLRRGESRIAEAYPETTVLFADVVGFTPWAQRTDPARIVELLDDLFTRLDQAAADCGVEKIKTVGDAYMAVAGAPAPRADHAEAAVAFARRVLATVADWRVANGLDLQVRVGLASGPVVGGVIGRRRILFDLWGATVNTAARMESTGLPGQIQLAASTRERLAPALACEARQLEVKGLGTLTTYLLGGA
jgi:adenylate cyclase